MRVEIDIKHKSITLLNDVPFDQVQKLVLGLKDIFGWDEHELKIVNRPQERIVYERLPDYMQIPPFPYSPNQVWCGASAAQILTTSNEYIRADN